MVAHQIEFMQMPFPHFDHLSWRIYEFTWLKWLLSPHVLMAASKRNLRRFLFRMFYFGKSVHGWWFQQWHHEGFSITHTHKKETKSTNFMLYLCKYKMILSSTLNYMHFHSHNDGGGKNNVLWNIVCDIKHLYRFVVWQSNINVRA